MTETHTPPKFSAELWAAFWAKPDIARAGDVLADDIVGYWQGDPTPVRGKEPYVGKIAELVSAIPDLTLDLIDSATADGDEPGEQLVFLHYVGTGTGPDGPLAFRGIDRVRARDGVVVENVIRYDVVDPT
ncbi:MAG TPA: nuclear transport factor 2 family protein [Mycobacterium sp.]|nr:nuclear transport factor 2 family protein [Mycobacterium sp.]